MNSNKWNKPPVHDKSAPVWPAERIARLAQTWSLGGVDEDAIQQGLESHFTVFKVPFRREFRLSSKDRVDFLIEDRVALEVKLTGRAIEVTKQLSRYADDSRVKELILVTARMQAGAVPLTLRGKPIFVVNLFRGLQ